jgi:cell division transport system permease protein
MPRWWRATFGNGADATRAGLALGRDDTPLHLDWIVASMAFLAALTLLGALVTADAAARWRHGLTASVTVEIPVASGTSPAAQPAERLARALSVLRAEPGVFSAEPVPRTRVAELLAPWLGKGDLADDLPVPQLVDVTLAPGGRTDLAGLAWRLSSTVDGATLDDHGAWIGELLRMARLAVGLAVAVVALVALTAIAAVVLATRAGLAVHREAIDLLHLIGAEDDYIARQFATRAMGLGLRGGLIGLGVAGLALLAIGIAGSTVDPKLLPRLWPTIGQLLPLLLVPPASAGLAWLTARQTVLRTLKRMT